MSAFVERLKVILYLIPILVAVVVLVGIVFLVIRDSRQQSRRADLPQPMRIVALEIVPPAS